MHRAISYDTNRVEGLLYPRVETSLYQRSNVIVNVLAGLPKLLTQLLDGESDQCRSTTW